MNRYEPLIEHVANVEGLHPEVLYRLCLEMAGELATLTTETRRPPKFAIYRHDDLKATFAPVITELLRCLGQLPDEVAVPIALEEKNYGCAVLQPNFTNIDEPNGPNRSPSGSNRILSNLGVWR